MEGADQFRSSTCGGLHPDELIVDNFAGGGGASTGIYLATGRHPDIAINHDREALAIYRANHPSTRVMCEDVFDVDPRLVTGRRRVGLAWFSPDCTHFSKARGGKPFRDRNRARRRRGLAGVVLKWAAQVRPRVICVENVEEFCFPTQTAVLSKRGLVPIGELHIGDEVWTHNARWKPVTQITRRRSDTVSVSGYGNSIVETTDNHQFYARQYAPRITTSGKRGRHDVRLLEPEWVRADRLADRNDSTTYSRAYSGYAWASPMELPRYWKRMPDALGVDTSAPAFFYMLGRWLGDGWIRKRKRKQDLIRICCNLPEADDLESHLMETGLSWYRSSHSDSVDVFDLSAESSRVLIPWLRRNFGEYADRKTLPAWVYGASEEQRWALVEGHADADGHEQNGGILQTTSVSRCLAVGLRLLLHSLGVAASIAVTEAHEAPRIDREGVMWCRPAYHVSWRRENQWLKGHLSGLHIWGRVRDVRPANQGVEVVDISVADDHSFVADGQVVHNCGWGPLGEDGLPDPARRGESFRRWVSRLRTLGYVVEWQELRACDYGAPTSRKRLFIIARCDGLPIQWPQRTHGPGRENPYRTAAECIDWTLPCPSIFERSKPLADATLRRIARGIRRYVIDAKQPFIVPTASQGKTHGEVVAVSPALIQMGHGEREGQAPRALDPGSPLGTVTAGGNHHALVTAFLAKHYGGGENGVQTPGVAVQLPLGTITAVDHHAVVACHLQRDFGGSTGAAMNEPHPTITAGGGGHAAIVTSSLIKLKGTCRDGQPVTEPLATIQAQGNHYAEVRAFLLTYYGTEQDPQLGLPLATVTTKDRFAVVTVAGTAYAIVDIGMRMLVPRELFRAQGFPKNYVIDPEVNGKPLTKTAQVHKCGNAVPPPFSKAIVEANFAIASMRVAA